jgi:hypothetical protein
MSNFLLQTLILVSYLISLFIIIHFLFSKEGGYWIIPLILNLYFVLTQAITTINSNGGTLPFNTEMFTSMPAFFSTTAGYYVLFGISILWLFLVLTFHHGFGKHKKPIDRRREMMKKNYYGAIYTEKLEKNAYKARMKRREQNRLYGARKPLVTDFSKEWIDKFDRT